MATHISLNNSLVPFKEIHSGDFFMYGENVWMKFTPDTPCLSNAYPDNAVYIPLHRNDESEDEVSRAANFEPGDMVIPLNAEISLSFIQ